ncbi:MAG: cobyrinic acid a,c-diamide synthase [Peptococcaceae bacterium BRH_c4a]|nr:MAG: cobyrinic acid a,c-diamide synthase [Peptococcaceae bacterium BRH_c4a]
MLLPRIVIAGVHSGVGKTTVATALMKALAKTGLKVQPFKVGPDYIDPGYHTAAAGRPCRNLDAWFLGADGVREMFVRSAAGADISVIEGVMGLYDGRGSGDEGSTAQVARLLKAPVILVLDARSMARSAAAMVLGYKSFDPELNLCGVILNRVGSERHCRLLTEAIEESTGIPVLGRLGHGSEMELPERHLGLLPTAEKNNLSSLLDTMAHKIREGVSLEGLVSLAGQAPPAPQPERLIFSENAAKPRARIGLVLDEAFNFYYRDGLELLGHLGAEMVDCSSLEGKLPADLDGLYIGGGFPEMFAREISQNLEFIMGVREGCARGMPVYAECGGMIFLSGAVTDFSGRRHKMAGIIPGETVMLKKRAALGYVTAVSLKDSILAPAGSRIKGHEFHYSTLQGMDPSHHAYLLKKEGEEGARPDGYSSGSLIAAYLHIHFAGCPREAGNFVGACAAFRHSRRFRP